MQSRSLKSAQSRLPKLTAVEGEEPLSLSFGTAAGVASVTVELRQPSPSHSVWATLDGRAEH